MEELNLVRVASTETESEAVFLRAALEDHGIQTMVNGLEIGAFSDVVDGGEIVLMVSKEDYDKAKKLVDEIQEGEDELIPAWTCKCGESVDEGFFLCWSCGAEYQATT